MGFTLTLFFFYHLLMVKDDITTNERIKKSDFIYNYERLIKELKLLISNPNLSPEDK